MLNRVQLERFGMKLTDPYLLPSVSKDVDFYSKVRLNLEPKNTIYDNLIKYDNNISIRLDD